MMIPGGWRDQDHNDEHEEAKEVVELMLPDGGHDKEQLLRCVARNVRDMHRGII